MQARKVHTENGWLWIKQGWWLFKKSPILWLTLTIIGVSGLIGVSILPMIGDPLATILFPVIFVGLMLGCRALEHDQELDLSHLFAGFQNNASQLMILGGINMAFQLLILGVVNLTGGAALVEIIMSGQPITDTAAFEKLMVEAGIAPFLGLLLFGVLMMAMQFAPMLVAFDKLSPFAALRTSLQAAFRNIVTLGIYGTIVILFAVMATLPMFLGWLILMPVMIASIYASYRDIFPLPTEIAPPVTVDNIS